MVSENQKADYYNPSKLVTWPWLKYINLNMTFRILLSFKVSCLTTWSAKPVCLGKS